MANFLTRLRAILPANPLQNTPVQNCCGRLTIDGERHFRLQHRSDLPLGAGVLSDEVIPNWPSSSMPSQDEDHHVDASFFKFLRGFQHTPLLPETVLAGQFQRIGNASANGQVRRVEFLSHGSNVQVALKESLLATSDSLLVEWFNGRGINYLRERYPIFPQTYQILHERKSQDRSRSQFVPVPSTSTLAQLVRLPRQGQVITTQLVPARRSLHDLRESLQFQAPAAQLENSECIMWSLYFLFQCIHQLRTEFHHYDLHTNNILMIELNQPLQVILKIDDHTTELIPLKYYPCVIDFGQVQVAEQSHQIFTSDLAWAYREAGVKYKHHDQTGLKHPFHRFRSTLHAVSVFTKLPSTPTFRAQAKQLVHEYEVLSRTNALGQPSRMTDQLSSLMNTMTGTVNPNWRAIDRAQIQQHINRHDTGVQVAMNEASSVYNQLAPPDAGLLALAALHDPPVVPPVALPVPVSPAISPVTSPIQLSSDSSVTPPIQLSSDSPPAAMFPAPVAPAPAAPAPALRQFVALGSTESESMNTGILPAAPAPAPAAFGAFGADRDYFNQWFLPAAPAPAAPAPAPTASLIRRHDAMGTTESIDSEDLPHQHPFKKPKHQ